MTDTFTITEQYQFKPNVPKERQLKFEKALHNLIAEYQFDVRYFKVEIIND